MDLVAHERQGEPRPLLALGATVSAVNMRKRFDELAMNLLEAFLPGHAPPRASR